MSAAQKLLVGLYIVIVRTAIAQRTVIIELQSINCYSYAPDWFKSKPAPRFNVRVVLEYYMATGIPVKLLDKNIDGCDYLKQITQQKQFKIVHKYLKKFVNKLPACPLKENFNYTIQDFNVDVNDIPSYLPDCTFRVTFYVSELPGTFVGLKAVVEGMKRHSNKLSGK